MIVTEDVAKEKWCPMACFAVPTGTQNPRCIGSGCMMWRWHDRENLHYHGDPEKKPKRHGFCGLAGAVREP